MAYKVPTKTVVIEELIKKSRFITLMAHTPGIDAAKAFWQHCKTQYPDARHWCFAAVAGEPGDGQQYAMSDDGEPAGTAGKPMLAQLLGSGIGEVAVVVVRYFGGVKLGTGGLVKAYGGGVSAALKQLTTQEVVAFKAFQLTLEYSAQNDVLYQIKQHQGIVVDEHFDHRVKMQVNIPVTASAAFTRWLAVRDDVSCQQEEQGK
ncbi:YigZ family protein [Gallaecimonas mangrovi]|uniref:YigZ family protein n=1 Tax=Gallaecimonas mangrovi TaxID=2291597 RepID=UPI000E20592C|nr:YigZ family protein [Gallaecimonas mangrovi]